MDVNFIDSDEVYYRICDCCENEDRSGPGLLHWEETQKFDLCFECLKELFFQYCSPEFKAVEQVVVKRATITEEERDTIFKRDNYQCVNCGSEENLSVDHIFPFSLGGNTDSLNLQTLCRSCNSSKGNRTNKHG